MFVRIPLSVALLIIFVFVFQVHAQDSNRASVSREKVISAVERALKTIPVPDNRRDDKSADQAPSKKARLLDVKVRTKQKEIELNFSKELLDYGLNGELDAVFDHILTKVSNLVTNWSEVNYKIRIEGTPLPDFYAESDRRAIENASPELNKDNNKDLSPNLLQGPLTGKRVVISPGHGWYRNGTAWSLQRGYWWGIVEDFVNAEMVMYLNSELLSTGADVRAARNMNKNAGNGTTGHPKWQESGKYHIRALGAPSSVWNSGPTDLDKDIRSRPLYANWVAGNILVSLHNNGGKGTGTEVWYDSTNGQQTQSKKLATIIHNKVVSAIKQNYNANWVGRALKSCEGCKGENRIATRPAVIIEVAFMDRQSPDNNALHDEAFKQLVARAIRDGIQEYFGAGSTTTFQPGEGSSNPAPWTQAFYRDSFNQYVISPTYNKVHAWGPGCIQDFRGTTSGVHAALMQPNCSGTVYTIYGGMWDKYISQGGATGYMGYPSTDRQHSTSGATGYSLDWQAFRKGGNEMALELHTDSRSSRYGSTYVVYGAIFQYWKNAGYEGSWLGIPISDEYTSGTEVVGGVTYRFRRQNFEGGYVRWREYNGTTQGYLY